MAANETNHMGAQQAIRLQLQHQQMLMKLTDDRKLLKQNLLLWQANVRKDNSNDCDSTDDHIFPVHSHETASERPTHESSATHEKRPVNVPWPKERLSLTSGLNDRDTEPGTDEVDGGRISPKLLSGDVNANLTLRTDSVCLIRSVSADCNATETRTTKSEATIDAGSKHDGTDSRLRSNVDFCTSQSSDRLQRSFTVGCKLFKSEQMVIEELSISNAQLKRLVRSLIEDKEQLQQENHALKQKMRADHSIAIVD
jgi:hypothetical protein